MQKYYDAGRNTSSMAPDPRFLHLHSTDINRDFIYLVFGSSNILLYICGENVRFFIVKVLVNRLESAGKLAPLFLYSILIPRDPRELVLIYFRSPE